MREEIDSDRRHFLGTALITVAASRFGLVNLTNTQDAAKSAADANMTAPSDRSSASSTSDSGSTMSAGAMWS